MLTEAEAVVWVHCFQCAQQSLACPGEVLESVDRVKSAWKVYMNQVRPSDCRTMAVAQERKRAAVAVDASLVVEDEKPGVVQRAMNFLTSLFKHPRTGP